MTLEQDLEFLRRSFDVARRAREAGDHPFGAILVGPDGEILREQGNGYRAEGGDRTAHAERLLASWAARTWTSRYLQRCTLYSSAEPCAMCAGAIYWAGIGRVVYGQSEKGPEGGDRRARREPDARSAVPGRVRGGSTADRGRRPVAGG